jgi:DNA-binding NtrC family response regulator
MPKLFLPQEYAFAQAASDLAFWNPFQPERVACERQALGADFNESDTAWRLGITLESGRSNIALLNARVAALLHKARARLHEGAVAREQEWQWYQDMVVYHIYHQLYDIFFESLAADDPRPAWTKAHALFMEGVDHYFTVPGSHFERYYTPQHLFACLFQVRRAFHYIYRYIVGTSSAMAKLRAATWQSIFTHNMRRYQYTLYERMGDVTTLILGASGTGKERVAQAIAKSSYLPFNPATRTFPEPPESLFNTTVLSALSPHLIESELFGHARGAFTGAHADRKGRLEECSRHASLFLDEIGETDPQAQVKLLRVLEYRTFQRVGDSKPRQFLGKIIAATNRDLAAEIDSGRFRRDFYYRLCSDVIHTPSLNEQLQECPADLANMVTFIARKLMADETEMTHLIADVQTWIDHHPGYPWPGNFRELEQCVRNIMIRRQYHPPQPRPLTEPAQLSAAIHAGTLTADQLLQHYCALVYAQTGSYEETARRLALDRRTVKARIGAQRQPHTA